jgi:asparagine synthase (glutamine-hydrolysing)
MAVEGFTPFSPFTRPSVVRVAEAIPFDRLTEGSHDRLYALKGEVLRRGVKALTGHDLPVYPKRRFQDGAAPADAVAERFGQPEMRYRSHWLARAATGA